MKTILRLNEISEVFISYFTAVRTYGLSYSPLSKIRCLGFEPNLYITTTFSSLEYTNKIVYKSSYLLNFIGLNALRPFSLLSPCWVRAYYINFIILSLSSH